MGHEREPELLMRVAHAGGAAAPLAAAPHAHAAARRSRSWLFLRTPLRMPSAPYMTHAVEMRWPKCGTKERAVKLCV